MEHPSSANRLETRPCERTHTDVFKTSLCCNGMSVQSAFSWTWSEKAHLHPARQYRPRVNAGGQLAHRMLRAWTWTCPDAPSFMMEGLLGFVKLTAPVPIEAHVKVQLGIALEWIFMTAQRGRPLALRELTKRDVLRLSAFP